jgi:hypothetical protein
MKTGAGKFRAAPLEPSAPERHRWTIVLQYPASDHQAAAYADGALLELDLEHPMAGAVVCSACEQAWVWAKSEPCAGRPQCGPSGRRGSG